MNVKLTSQWEKEPTTSDYAEKRILPEGVLYENIKHLPSNNIFNIVDAKVKIKQRISTKMLSNTGEEDYLALRVLLSGHDFMTSNDIPYPLETSAECYCITGRVENIATYSPTPDIEINNLSLVILKKDLLFLTEENELPNVIKDYLTKDYNPFGISHKTSLSMKNIFQEIRKNNYHGLTQSLFLQAKSWELLAEVFSHLNNSKKSNSLSFKEQNNILKIKDLLCENIHSPPSLEQLAAEARTSPRKLNQAFKNTYGKTIFEWFSEWKLNHARELLIDNELSIKEIAFNLGYSHENNFINAFSRQFGIPPARYRAENRAKIIAPKLDLVYKA